MERDTLHREFERLSQTNDVAGLQALVPYIEDSDPMAAQILNCIGHALGVTATTYATLQQGVNLLRRGVPLAQNDVLQAKLLGNLAAFYNWGNALTQVMAVVEQHMQLRLSPEDAWLYGMALLHRSIAKARSREYVAAEQDAFQALSYPVGAGVQQRARIQLATLAARRSDAATVAQHLESVENPALIPYVTGVRARLALALGTPYTAMELARQAASALAAVAPRAHIWGEQLEAWALYHEASLAAGEAERARNINSVLISMNGGTEYRSIWG